MHYYEHDDTIAPLYCYEHAWEGGLDEDCPECAGENEQEDMRTDDGRIMS